LYLDGSLHSGHDWRACGLPVPQDCTNIASYHVVLFALFCHILYNGYGVIDTNDKLPGNISHQFLLAIAFHTHNRIARLNHMT
jgi:hypothetical protein